MARSRLLQHIDSLPALMADLIMPLARAVAAVVPASRCAQISRVFLTGCGDSHHAAVGAALAFRQFAHVSCIPLTALSCSRYHAPYLADSRRAGETDLLVAISVSGGVTRTIEALDLCRQAGAWTLAITGNDQTPLAQAGESVIETRVPPLPADTPEIVVPGMRSYVASQLALYLLAIQLGQGRGHLTKMAADSLRWEIAGMANNAAQTIANCDPRAHALCQTWTDATHFVFCGGGPNYGAALFNAAKMLEASGDPALAQDMEEWAHLQYFSREPHTPTLLISAGAADNDRVQEIAIAATTIGRRVALIAPTTTAAADTLPLQNTLPIAAPVRECFSPSSPPCRARSSPPTAPRKPANPTSAPLAAGAASKAAAASPVSAPATARPG